MMNGLPTIYGSEADEDHVMKNELGLAIHVKKVKFQERVPIGNQQPYQCLYTKDYKHKGRVSNRKAYRQRGFSFPRLPPRGPACLARQTDVRSFIETKSSDERRPISGLSSVCSASNWQAGSISSSCISQSNPLMTHTNARHSDDSGSLKQIENLPTIPQIDGDDECSRNMYSNVGTDILQTGDVPNRQHETFHPNEFIENDYDFTTEPHYETVADVRNPRFTYYDSRNNSFLPNVDYDNFQSLRKMPVKFFDKNVVKAKVDSGAVVRLPKKEKEKKAVEAKKPTTHWQSRNELLPDNTQEGCILYCAVSSDNKSENELNYCHVKEGDMNVSKNEIEGLIPGAKGVIGKYSQKLSDDLDQEVDEGKRKGQLCTETTQENSNMKDSSDFKYCGNSPSKYRKQLENAFNSSICPDDQAYLSLSSGQTTPTKEHTEQMFACDSAPVAISTCASSFASLENLTRSTEAKEKQTKQIRDDESQTIKEKENVLSDETKVILSSADAHLDSLVDCNDQEEIKLSENCPNRNPTFSAQSDNIKNSLFENDSENKLSGKQHDPNQNQNFTDEPEENESESNEYYEESYFKNSGEEPPCWIFEMNTAKSTREKQRKLISRKKCNMTIQPRRLLQPSIYNIDNAKAQQQSICKSRSVSIVNPLKSHLDQPSSNYFRYVVEKNQIGMKGRQMLDGNQDRGKDLILCRNCKSELSHRFNMQRDNMGNINMYSKSCIGQKGFHGGKKNLKVSMKVTDWIKRNESFFNISH